MIDQEDVQDENSNSNTRLSREQPSPHHEHHPLLPYTRTPDDTTIVAKELPVDTGSFIDQILTSIGSGLFQAIAFFLASLTYFAYACEVLTFTFISLDVSSKWQLSAVQFAVLPAVTCITNIIGSALFSYLADKHGRVWPCIGSLTILSVFVLASAASTSYTILVFLRAMSSIGVGGIVVLIHPMLIEFLPITNRGNVTILTGLIQSIGSCAAGAMAWLLLPRYPEYGWRLFIIATAMPSVFVLMFRMLFRIESPRLLISMNKPDEAWNSLAVMARVNGKSLDSIISKENFLFFVNKHHNNSALPESYSTCDKPYNWHCSVARKFQCIFHSPYLMQTICLVVIYNTQQLAYFGSTLFLPVLLNNLTFEPFLIAFVGFTAQIPGILLIAIITEWPEFGRINTLRIFTAMSVIFFTLFAFVQTTVSIPVLTVLIYFTMGPMKTLLLTFISESYPTEIRSMAMALITSSSSVNGIWLCFVSGYLANVSVQYSWLSPTVWGCVLSVQLLVSMFLKRETLGKTLNDSV